MTDDKHTTPERRAADTPRAMIKDLGAAWPGRQNDHADASISTLGSHARPSIRRVTKSALLAALPAEARAFVLRREISVVHPTVRTVAVEQVGPVVSETSSLHLAAIKWGGVP